MMSTVVAVTSSKSKAIFTNMFAGDLQATFQELTTPMKDASAKLRGKFMDMYERQALAAMRSLNSVGDCEVAQRELGVLMGSCKGFEGPAAQEVVAKLKVFQGQAEATRKTIGKSSQTQVVSDASQALLDLFPRGYPTVLHTKSVEERKSQCLDCFMCWNLFCLRLLRFFEQFPEAQFDSARHPDQRGERLLVVADRQACPGLLQFSLLPCPSFCISFSLKAARTSRTALSRPRPHSCSRMRRQPLRA